MLARMSRRALVLIVSRDVERATTLLIMGVKVGSMLDRARARFRVALPQRKASAPLVPRGWGATASIVLVQWARQPGPLVPMKTGRLPAMLAWWTVVAA